MTRDVITRCDFCREVIPDDGRDRLSITSASRGGTQRNFDLCHSCFVKINAVPSRVDPYAARLRDLTDTGVTPKPTDTPIEAAYRSGGVLWGQNET